jgi:CO/xanthine dehydrogenase FAD-binding subunit
MVDCYQATSLKEALHIRATRTVVPYGGGTDLMVNDNETLHYLFLNKVPELQRIYEDEQYIHIGAGCTFTELLGSALVPEIMKEAIQQIAAPAIRNMATIGGNIGNGSAKADSVLIDYVLEAKLLLARESENRIVDIDAFYLGRKKLDLGEDELIVEILIPKSDFCNYYYQKVGARNALAISRVSFAGLFSIEGDQITKVACAFGAVSDVVLRFKDLEKMLIGKTLAEAKLVKEDVIRAYSEAIIPISGRVSAEYRKAVCINLLNDFLGKNGI